MKYLLLILALLVCGNVWAESYKLMNDGYIQRQSDLALIPPTDANPDYVKYLEDKQNGADVSAFDHEQEAVRQFKAIAESKQKKDDEDMIQTKLREMAISSLKSEGKLKNYSESGRK